MGINVTALRNKLVGGGARPSLFFSTIYFPSNIESVLKASYGFDTQEISFFIKAASIPESTLGEITKTFLGRDIKLPSIDRTFAPWSVTIMNDENYKIRHFFESWIEYVSPGASIFEAESGFGSNAAKSVYGQMQVHQLQKDGGISRLTDDKGPYLGSYYFKDCFPTSVDQITLSWDDKDTIEEFTVTFAYQYWVKNPEELSVTGNKTTNPFTGNTDDKPREGIDSADNWVGEKIKEKAS